jgi:hypothetical protein
VIVVSSPGRRRPEAARRAGLEESRGSCNDCELLSQLTRHLSAALPEPLTLGLRRSCLGADAPRGFLVAGVARCTRWPHLG